MIPNSIARHITKAMRKAGLSSTAYRTREKKLLVWGLSNEKKVNGLGMA
jgi:hypothetical protein